MCSGVGDEGVESCFLWRVESVIFAEHFGEAAFAVGQAGGDFFWDGGQMEFRQVEFDGIEHADQDSSATGAANGFVSPAGAAIQGGV